MKFYLMSFESTLIGLLLVNEFWVLLLDPFKGLKLETIRPTLRRRVKLAPRKYKSHTYKSYQVNKLYRIPKKKK